MQSEGGQNQMDNVAPIDKVDNSKNDPFKKQDYNKERKDDSNKRNEKDQRDERSKNYQPAH